VRCVALQSIGKDELKELLRKVRTASHVEELKPMIKEVLSKLNPADLALAEQELRAEGISVEEIRKLCESHLHLLEAESHHKREEEALFPELEGRGVAGPPKVMRMEHKEFRAHRGALKELLDNHKKFSYEGFLAGLREGIYIIRNLESHIFKENNILYPTALQVLKEDDWVRVRRKFDEIGYRSFTPGVRGK
jgi:DUF438 domain-containing protein